MRYKLAIIFLTTLFLNSCVIMINENDYRGLNEKETKKYSAFSLEAANKVKVPVSSFKISEINSENIKEVTKQNEYTWVHLWKPFCAAEYCQNIGIFQEIDEKKSNLKLLMISENYAYKSIQEIVDRAKFERPVFVLQDSYFGHKIKGNRKKLEADLTGNSKKELSKYGYGSYLFKGTELLFAGYELNETTIDSLLSL